MADSLRPHPRLVIHDIQLTRIETAQGRSGVVATVECEHHRGTRMVEDCSKCERFARIDVHEAGYTLVCHSADLGDAKADAAEHHGAAGVVDEATKDAHLGPRQA